VVQSQESLLELFNLLDLRNQQLGWERYDWRDLDSHALLLPQGATFGRRTLRYVVRGTDLLAPAVVHRLLRVRKTIVPTAFYHVGMAHLLWERLTGEKPVGRDPLEEACSEAFAARLDAAHLCWDHPYSAHASSWKQNNETESPSSCLHHTTRLGELFLRAGASRRRQDWTDAGISAANALMTYHNWTTHDDGSVTVSYYPFTRDETINTATDAAMMLSLIPQAVREPHVQRRIDGVIRTVLSEQQGDGSWYYCTSRHYERTSDRKFIDNHHTAQVLQALGKIAATGTLEAHVAEDVRASIARGLQFYLDRFYDSSGRGSYFPTARSRPAHIVGYTEGIAAVYWAFRCGAIRDACGTRQYAEKVSAMMANAIKMVDRRTGDVACTRVLGRCYHIQSLRWGSGPLMEAIVYTLLLRKEIAIGS